MTMQNTRKKILFINSHSPYENFIAQEAQDMLLAANAFNHVVSIIFMDDGVLQLKNQHENLQLKDFTSAYKALPTYGIENVFVLEESLKTRELTVENLVLPVKLIDTNELPNILQTQDCIINF